MIQICQTVLKCTITDVTMITSLLSGRWSQRLNMWAIQPWCEVNFAFSRLELSSLYDETEVQRVPFYKQWSYCVSWHQLEKHARGQVTYLVFCAFLHLIGFLRVLYPAEGNAHKVIAFWTAKDWDWDQHNSSFISKVYWVPLTRIALSLAFWWKSALSHVFLWVLSTPEAPFLSGMAA